MIFLTKIGCLHRKINEGTDDVQVKLLRDPFVSLTADIHIEAPFRVRSINQFATYAAEQGVDGYPVGLFMLQC